MTFKIVAVGWNCAPFIHQTLESVACQTFDDWEIMITYDGGTDGGDRFVRQWCDTRDERWRYIINEEPKYDVRSRYEACDALDPADDDVIIFLDLDGDMLAHPNVLAHLDSYYDDNTLLTYGSYQSLPFSPTCAQAVQYPAEVIAARSYRRADQLFNHLRTMRGRLFRAIPLSQFKWSDNSSQAGQWYTKGCDRVFTIPGLELAGDRFKVISEVLMFYNSENPNSAWRVCLSEIDSCMNDFNARPILDVLP